MINIVPTVVRSMLNFAKNHAMIIGCALFLIILIPVGIIAACYAVVSPYKKYVTAVSEAQHTKVGIVLGAGITKDGKPYKELEARLDVAAQAITEGTVDKLILSGDNRFREYNEPEAMKDYLVETKGIAADKLQPDYAGRSTYESCERAAKIFGVQETIIFSAQSHLPRAIYLCRHFGIEAYGVSSGVEANNSTRREFLARIKAVYNAVLVGEPTVLGEPIAVNKD